MYKLSKDGVRLARHPMAVHGFFSRYRTLTRWILISLFFLLPWIKVNGLPSILINIPDRRFTFFWMSFWGHDAPLFFFVLASFTLGLLFVTSAWGRVWCGWACPQTIGIDGIFRQIEVLVEGNHTARLKLDRVPFDREKIVKRSTKWFLFILMSWLVSLTFLSYFIRSEDLITMVVSPPHENWIPFLITTVITLVVAFNYCWYREQFCTDVCPYGRLQSVLMDEDSITVVYDEKRGEPRKGRLPEKGKTGDCIDCFKCVVVCPTGIDIRRGIQMECIACTSCIDACNEVMQKVKKPKGLIRYDSENGLKGQKSLFWRMRTCVYLGLCFSAFIGLFLYVYGRSDLDVTVLRAHERPYQVLHTSQEMTLITNHFRVNLKNQSYEELEVDLQQTEEMKASGIDIVASKFPETVQFGETIEDHIFIKFPQSVLDKKGQMTFQLHIVAKSKKGRETLRKDIHLVGPSKPVIE